MQQLGLLRWLALLLGLKALRANSHSGSLREGEVIGTRFLSQIMWELRVSGRALGQK